MEGLPGLSEADLRQAVLMVAVLDDVDVVPHDDGVVLQATMSVGWSNDLLVRRTWLDRALADLAGDDGRIDPLAPAVRERLARWLRLARRLGDLPVGTLRDHLRPVGLPTGHVLHPGADWVRAVVPGDVLHLGLGLVGIGDDPDAVEVPPPYLLEATGLDPQGAWPAAVAYLERMGAIAAMRLERDPRAPLRPMGDCDAVTLLGSTVLRSALAADRGVGMRALSVPMRSRGWFDPSHLDSAFARAAAAATEDEARGFDRPVLVTIDGVWPALDGMDLAAFALRDPASAGLWARSQVLGSSG